MTEFLNGVNPVAPAEIATYLDDSIARIAMLEAIVSAAIEAHALWALHPQLEMYRAGLALSLSQPLDDFLDNGFNVTLLPPDGNPFGLPLYLARVLAISPEASAAYVLASPEELRTPASRLTPPFPIGIPTLIEAIRNSTPPQ